MRSCKPLWMMPAMICLLVAWTGCQNGDGPDKSTGRPDAEEKVSSNEGKGTEKNTDQKNGGEGEGQPKSDTEPEVKPPATIPPVNLLEKDRDACVVFVGDTMREVELPDQNDSVQALHELYGQKATVVCFWTNGEPPYGPISATGLLEDLQRDYAKPYAEKGLKVIAINVGDTAEIVSQQVQQSGATFPMLLDPEAGYFKKEVAKEKLPRLYLLDAQGKILWLDIEYSGPTREQLDQAVRAALEEN